MAASSSSAILFNDVFQVTDVDKGTFLSRLLFATLADEFAVCLDGKKFDRG